MLVYQPRKSILLIMKRLFLILFVATVSSAFFRWGVDISVRCGENLTVLTFGADSSATDGYDPYLDVPYFPTPGGGYGYFNLVDPLFPSYTMLSVDYRAPSSGEMNWDLRLGGGSNFVISWSPADLPDSGEFRIGAYEMDSLPEFVVVEWLDMHIADSISIFSLGGEIRAEGAPVSAIGEHAPARSQSMSISAYPNPFNSTVAIAINGVGAGLAPACVEIFDVNGRMVYEMTVGGACMRPAGGIHPAPTMHEYTWQPDESLGSGVYLVRASINSCQTSQRIVYLK